MKKHKCVDNQLFGQWEPAIIICYEKSDGTLWVTNDEYSSRVNYCPFCGYQTKYTMDEKQDSEPLDWKDI
jgi:hypothetical protein